MEIICKCCQLFDENYGTYARITGGHQWILVQKYICHFEKIQKEPVYKAHSLGINHPELRQELYTSLVQTILCLGLYFSTEGHS